MATSTTHVSGPQPDVTTLAFDVYGTLIDTAQVTGALARHVGSRAKAFAAAWRETQLAYSFRRALMQDYVDFAVCTRQALLHTAAVFDVTLASAAVDELLALYRVLPAFPDVLPGLDALAELPVRICAFSNGRPDDLESLLTQAGIRDRFAQVVSLYPARTFKPNPAAYAYFHRAARTGGNATWLISGNPFDIIGAQATGMKGLWVRRTPQAIFDPWEVEPTAVAASLTHAADFFRNHLA